MTGPSYRFGSFVADRIRYRVTRHETVVDLTPKLLDLLLHLLDNAGALVTKEQLLDALWPGANVTDNALAQAVSELRQALGDEAGTPQFIKTVARRGYRFIAPITRLEAPTEASQAARMPGRSEDGRAPSDRPGGRAIAVIDFANVTGEAESAWLSAGIAETVTGDLRALGRFRVVDRGRVIEAIRRTNGSLHEVAADLDAPLAVVGSYQRNGIRIRITGRIVDVRSGEALADAKVDGLLADIFELQDQVVAQFSKELGIATDMAGGSGSRETPSLEAYRAFTEGWLQLETLDVGQIPLAIGSFERAIQVDDRYALAYTGLASAELAATEGTRADAAPAVVRLDSAIAHARRAVTLEDTLAEAHATLGFVLVSAWQTIEALQCARRAVALEPTNWRHFFRLGHAAWGAERLQAAAHTLALYPNFAFAHFQTAMVHVARGHLAHAETVLRQGAAVQDRQIDRGDRYPALGLHWLLGSVRLAQGDAEEAIREFDRELQLAEPHRLYGREYEISSLEGRGAAMLRLGCSADAADCFRRALTVSPEHPRSHIGLSLTLRAAGSHEAADVASQRARAASAPINATRPIEAATVQAHLLTLEGRGHEAGALLCSALDAAPPGFAMWTLPIEPLLFQVDSREAFTAALLRLSERAR